GYLIGGVPRGMARGFALGSPPWFVVEGDEYDSAYFDKEAKFLDYRPHRLLLTAVEFDHADIYRDLAHVQAAFRKLLGILPAGAPCASRARTPAAAASSSRSSSTRSPRRTKRCWRRSSTSRATRSRRPSGSRRRRSSTGSSRAASRRACCPACRRSATTWRRR